MNFRIFSILVLLIGLPSEALAMHIAEGFLPPTWSIIWAILFVPFLVIGFKKTSKTVGQVSEAKYLYAVVGAFVFVLSSLKLPSVAGSSSHLTGMAIGALIFGASSMSVIGLIVLLFQALLLAHGGLTTLGANAFSMAIVGSFSAVFIYALCKKLNLKTNLSIFLAAFVSDLSIYICTSAQLSLAFQDTAPFMENLIKFMSVFAVTQVPLAFVEGFLSIYLFKFLKKYSNQELQLINPKLRE